MLPQVYLLAIFQLTFSTYLFLVLRLPIVVFVFELSSSIEYCSLLNVLET